MYVLELIVLSIFHNIITIKNIMSVYIYNKDTLKNNYSYNYAVSYITY